MRKHQSKTALRHLWWLSFRSAWMTFGHILLADWYALTFREDRAQAALEDALYHEDLSRQAEYLLRHVQSHETENAEG